MTRLFRRALTLALPAAALGTPLAGSAPAEAQTTAAGTPAVASPPAITRTDLQRQGLTASGWEVVQARVAFGPGALAAPHKHPGEEIAYVIEGLIEYRLAGLPTVRLGVGDALFIPAGTVHSARNVGEGRAVELATYVVEIGKPLVVFAD